ncbi:8938_t:CDS:2 [Dentiscutata erythropus]|uniref:8938_t:CDS:1 n=1 Tax=Dentiscutata erythropus TaxID=1348616 RepID=A0A9N9C6K9_9GLOM|nr:8938_t:CDS:2 [Dentiscutata erythropus]
MATSIKTPEKRMSRVSCVDTSYRLIDEIKHIVINLKRSKKIFDPIIHSSSETVRALHYVKYEVELYFQQYEDAFNRYKISLENIKEFAKEIEHENCEKRLHPILIKAIMDKQERQQEDIMNIHKILKTIPDGNKNEKIAQIEKIIQNIIQRSDLDINVPRIDSALLFDPPRAGENLENGLDRTTEWDLEDCFVMLLWELAFQRIPYENMSKDKIIAHVTQGRRETPNQPFFTLDVLNIQRKYLKIITDGWDNKPEKRITMDEILWRFLNIEAELAKLKKDNLGSAKRLRSISYPEKSIYNFKRFPNQLKSKESLALNLEGVDEEDIPYFIKSPMDIDFNSKRWKLEKPNKIEPVPTRLSSVVEAPSDAPYSSEKYKEIISKQKEDGSIELDDSVCNELNAPKEDIITTIKNNITSKNLQLPEFSSSLETAINLSYLKNFASQHEDEWRDNYNKALEYLSKQIGDGDAEKELLECADKYVANKVTGKVIEEKKWVSEKDEIPKAEKHKGKSFLGGIYETVSSKIGEISDQIGNTLTSDKNKHEEPEQRSEHEKKKESGSSYFGEPKIEEEPEKKPEKKSEHRKAFFGTPDKEEVSSISPLVHPTVSKDDYKADILNAIQDETTQTIILNKHIEDIITDDKEPDQSEKEDAFDTTKESVTPEICKAITSTADDDGRIELNETVCKEFDLSKEEIINAVQNNITNKKLKSPGLLSTAINLSYLKNAAPEFEDQWKNEYDKAREYLSKQIRNASAEKELLEFTDNYVIDSCAKKVIKDKKRFAIVRLQTSITPDKYEAAVSKQKEDGSFELSETICNELEVPMEDIMTKVKMNTNNKRLQSPKSDLWWKTALTMSYLQVAAPYYESQWKGKFNKAYEYLSKQIGDANIEKELLKCTSKYVIDRAYDLNNSQENIIYVPKLDFNEEILQKVHEDLRFSVDADAARTICNTQREDGSFTLDSLITDHLGIKPEEAIKSLKRFAISPKLRECDDSVWHTAFTIYYLKTILINYENEWRNAYDNANKWLYKQINDTTLEKELFSACEQYLIYSTNLKDAERLKILKLRVDDKTRKAIFDDLRSNVTAELARSLCSAQENNGSFSPNALTMLRPLIPSPASTVESLKLYVGSTKLSTCIDSIWYTAFTIYYFKNVLVNYKKEWRHAYDRASIWINEQIDDAEAEKELYSACEQYLIHQGVDFINNRGRIEESQEEVEVFEVRVSEEVRKAVHKSLRDDVTEEVSRILCNSQESNGSFTLHKSISDHLKIPSADDAVETLKSYVGSLFLRSRNPSVWCTALTITYLKTVCDNYEQVWRPACERAAAWISQQCKDPEEEKELSSACDQYLIKQGVEVLNEKNRRLSKRQETSKSMETPFKQL